MESGHTGRIFREGSNSPEESAYRKLDVVSSCAHSQVFFRTEGVASVKVLLITDKKTTDWLVCIFLKTSNLLFVLHASYLIGWGGQFGCTGVGTAELGLISIAL